MTEVMTASKLIENIVMGYVADGLGPYKNEIKSCLNHR